MIEASRSISIWMALITGYTVIDIPAYTQVLIIHISLVMIMAINAGIQAIVTGIGMAFRTIIPFSVVLTGIDREMLTIMIEGRGLPGYCIVAVLTRGGKLGGTMRRVQ